MLERELSNRSVPWKEGQTRDSVVPIPIAQVIWNREGRGGEILRVIRRNISTRH